MSSHCRPGITLGLSAVVIFTALPSSASEPVAPSAIQTSTVPSFHGLSAADAKRVAEKAGIEIDFEWGVPANDPASAYRIYSQSLEAGKQLTPPAKVIVRFHAEPAVEHRPMLKDPDSSPRQARIAGSRRMPDLVGLELDDARAAARALGLSTTHRDGIAANAPHLQSRVYAHAPAAGAPIDPMTEVELVIHGPFSKAPDGPNLSQELRSVGVASINLGGTNGVDQETGRLLLFHNDLVFNAGANVISVQRVLLPESRRDGLLGRRWRLNWEKSLRISGTLAVLEDGGALTVFLFDPRRNVWESPEGESLRVTKDGSRRKLPDGTEYVFDAKGRFVEQIEPNGARFQLTYDDKERLALVTGPFQSWLRFLVTGKGRLARIDSSAGMIARYGFGDTPNWNVPHDLTFRFKYDRHGRPERVEDPTRGTMEIEYDERQRVTRRSWLDQGDERYVHDDHAGTRRYVDPRGRTTLVETKQHRGGRRVTTTDPFGRREIREYDVKGRLLALRDVWGQTTRYAYDPLGRTVQTENEAGSTRLAYLGETRLPTVVETASGATTFEYDGRLNLIRVRAGNTTLRERKYDAHGLMISSKDGDAPPITYSYDQHGRLVTIESPTDGRTRLNYDRRGNRIERVDALGNKESWAFDEFDRLTRATDMSGRETTFTYGIRGELVKISDSSGSEVDFIHRRDGKLLSRRGPGEYSIHYDYDPRGRLLRLETSEGVIERFAYDGNGNLIERQSSLGAVWTYLHDRFGRRIEERGPHGYRRAIAYDSRNAIVSTTDGLGRVTKFEYDTSGRVIAIMDPAGRRQECHYDAEGRLVEAKDALGRRIRLQIDELGRMRGISQDSQVLVEFDRGAGGTLSVHRPANPSVRFDFDSAGRPARQVYANGEQFSFTHDSLGRITSASDAAGNAWRAEYSPAGELVKFQSPLGPAFVYAYQNGRVTRIQDPLGRARQCEYDAHGNRIRTTDPLGRSITFDHGPSGEVRSLQSADGNTTTFRHDLLGRIASIHPPEGPPIEYEYDAVGNRIETRQGDYRETSRFDALNRVTEITYQPIGQTVRFRYDDADRRTGLEIVGIGAWTYTYDPLDRLTTVSDNAGATTRFEYDEVGRLAIAKLANGMEVRRRYDARGRMIELTVTDENDKQLFQRLYEHGPTGNVVRISGGAPGDIRLSYDAEDRLIKEMAAGKTRVWKYDEVGNRLFPGHGEYDVADQVLRLDNETFKHDPRGALIERRADDVTTSYRHDTAGRLVAVTRNGATVAKYGYDPEGRRIFKKTGGQVTRYVYDGLRLLLTIRDDKPVAWPSSPMLEIGMTDGSNRRYPITDLTGSVIALADEQGSLIRTWDYDPFGELLSGNDGEDATPIPFGFAGGQHDPETGLVYFHARYYDPRMGRFLTPDPAPGKLTNPASLHPYQYAYNNPLRYSDPYGATAAEIADGIADAAGSAGATVGYGLGYSIGYLVSSPIRAANWVTGNKESTARLDQALDTYSRDVTGVLADTLAATATTIVVDPLRIGSGVGTASVNVEQGEYGMATLNTLGDIGRAIPISKAISSAYRPAVNFLSGTGSPSKLYSAQNNPTEILESGRIWGQTEGSVYAGTNPRTDSITGYLANTREPRAGDVAFVFEGQAATLFKPHEITGPFGLLKRLGGQHKAGFGDIKINGWSSGPNGEIVVTNAELLAGQHAGPLLWDLFTQGQRLAGRRTFDAFAAGVFGLWTANEIAKKLDDTLGEMGRQAVSRDPVADLIRLVTGDDDGTPPQEEQVADFPDWDEGLDDELLARAEELERLAAADLAALDRAGVLDRQLTQVERERQRAWEKELNRQARDNWLDDQRGDWGGYNNDWVQGIVPLIELIGRASQGAGSSGRGREGHHHPH